MGNYCQSCQLYNKKEPTLEIQCEMKQENPLTPLQITSTDQNIQRDKKSNVDIDQNNNQQQQIEKLQQMQRNQEFKYRQNQDVDDFFSDISDILSDMQFPGQTQLIRKSSQEQSKDEQKQQCTNTNHNLSFDLDQVNKLTEKTNLNEKDLFSEVNQYNQLQKNQIFDQKIQEQKNNYNVIGMFDGGGNNQSSEKNSDLDKCIDIIDQSNSDKFQNNQELNDNKYNHNTTNNFLGLQDI